MDGAVVGTSECTHALHEQVDFGSLEDSNAELVLVDQAVLRASHILRQPPPLPDTAQRESSHRRLGVGLGAQFRITDRQRF